MGTRALPTSGRGPAARGALLAGMATGLTLGWFGLALFSRRLAGLPPLTGADLTRGGFDLYILGFALRVVLVPLAALYLLSGTGWFKRAADGEASRGDRRRLFAALAAIQAITLFFDWGLVYLTGEQVSLGLLVVVAGAWLGGWRAGLGLGLLTMLIRGTQDLITYPNEDLAAALGDGRLGDLLDLPMWGDIVLYNFLANLWAMIGLWAGLTAGIAGAALGGRRWRPAAACALGAGADLFAGYMLAISWDNPGDTTELIAPNMLISGLAMTAMALIVRNAQLDRARRRAEAAELARTQAELRALQAQINPHFLFNALNTIRYFIRTHPDTARDLILKLSEVFQRVLRSGESVPLRDEIGYVQAYLALEAARLGDRLRHSWSVADEALLDCSVPTLILQPIVENAVKHGIAPKEAGGEICIAVERAGGDLRLQVRDDGVGIAPARLGELLAADYRGPSIGLNNIDRRLATLYGERYRLRIESTEAAGTCVVINIPIEVIECAS